MEKHFGHLGWNSQTDSLLPERAALALIDLVDLLVSGLSNSEDMSKFLEEHRRQALLSLRTLFVSLAAQPGRPQMSKYRSAAAFCVLKGKISAHDLCKEFEPGYRSMSRDEQAKARQKMRAGVRRVLKAGTNSPS